VIMLVQLFGHWSLPASAVDQASNQSFQDEIR
jgi:hypothetical protein